MADSIQLLTAGMQQSQAVFNSINHAIEEKMNAEQQNQQFAVGMAFKGAQFAEEQRMNTAQIANIKADNELKAKQFEIYKNLAPVQLENQKLQLDISREEYKQKMEYDRELLPFRIAETKARSTAAQEAAKLAVQNSAKSSFNEMTKMEDDNVQLDIIRTGDVEYAKEFNEIKAKHFAGLAAGKSFDATAYQNDLHALKEKYKDKTKDDDAAYSEEFSHVLGTIDPSLQKQYERKNPTIISSVNMALGSALTAPDSEVGDLVKPFLGIIPEDKIAGFQLSRNAIKQNQRQIEALQKEITASENSLNTIKDPDEAAAQRKREETSKSIEDKQRRRDELIAQNEVIIQNGNSGVYGHKALKVAVDESKPENQSGKDQRINSILSNIAQSPDNQASKLIDRFGAVLPPEKLAIAVKAKQEIEANTLGYKKDQEEVIRLHNALLSLPPGTDKARIKEIQTAQKKYEDSAKEKLSKNQKIVSDLTLGIYGEQAKATDPAKKNPLADSSVNRNEPILGVDSTREEDSKLKQKLAKVTSVIGFHKGKIEEDGSISNAVDESNTELRGINLKWFEGRVRKGVDDKSLNTIKDTIKDNIEQQGSIDKIFRAPRIDGIIKTVDRPTEVPVSPHLSSVLASMPADEAANVAGFGFGQDLKKNFKIIVNPNKPTGFLSTIMGTDRGIASYKDIETILAHVEDKTEREEVKKELYSALLTASLAHAIKD